MFKSGLKKRQHKILMTEKRQTGYIYSIRSHQTDNYYIGSTFGPLRQRLFIHKSHLKKYNESNGNYITSFEILKYSDAYIELVETYENINKMELQKNEGEYIRKNTKCINKNIAGRTKIEYNKDNKEYYKEYYKEYRNDNKERIKEYYEDNKERKKEYYEDNKEQIKEYNKEYKDKTKERRQVKYLCKCGKTLTTGCKARHNKICKDQTGTECKAE